MKKSLAILLAFVCFFCGLNDIVLKAEGYEETESCLFESADKREGIISDGYTLDAGSYLL